MDLTELVTRMKKTINRLLGEERKVSSSSREKFSTLSIWCTDRKRSSFNESASFEDWIVRSVQIYRSDSHPTCSVCVCVCVNRNGTVFSVCACWILSDFRSLHFLHTLTHTPSLFLYTALLIFFLSIETTITLCWLRERKKIRFQLIRSCWVSNRSTEPSK